VQSREEGKEEVKESMSLFCKFQPFQSFLSDSIHSTLKEFLDIILYQIYVLILILKLGFFAFSWINIIYQHYNTLLTEGFL